MFRADEETRELVTPYNDHRPHSALAYVTPRDMLERRQAAIHRLRGQQSGSRVRIVFACVQRFNA
jgi:hypothetical protein